MKKAKAQRRAKLPLDDPSRWWPWGRAIEHVRQRRLNHVIADQELATAINERHVSCKMEWLDARTDPPRRVAMLLDDSFFAAFRIEPGWGKLLAVGQRPDARLPRDHVLYAWSPNIEKIWEQPAPSVQEPSRKGSRESRKGSRVHDEIRRFADREWPKRRWERIEMRVIIDRANHDPEFKKRVDPFPSRYQFSRALGRKD